jgi:aryl-alcohol dehydrogenase-like predicted oxidoreductase
MLPYCEDQGIGVIAWSPLAPGRLAHPAEEARSSTSGRQDALYDDATETDDRAVLDAVGEVFGELGAHRAQVALRWIMSKKEVAAPIIGATKLQHLEDALATTELSLSGEQLERLEASYRAPVAYLCVEICSRSSGGCGPRLCALKATVLSAFECRVSRGPD